MGGKGSWKAAPPIKFFRQIRKFPRLNPLIHVGEAAAGWPMAAAGLSLLQTTGFADDSRQSSLRMFAQFMREHERGLFNYVLRLVGSREEAEDITQEAFLQAYRNWMKIDPGEPGGYVKWCYRTAHNLAIDALRKKRPKAIDEEELERATDARSLRPEEVFEH